MNNKEWAKEIIWNMLGSSGTKADIVFMTAALDKAHRRGWEEGVTDYAVWSNGEQLVGVMRRPLKKVLEDGPDGV